MKNNSIKIGIILFLMVMTLLNTSLTLSNQITLKNPGVFIERASFGNAFENLDPALVSQAQSATVDSWIAQSLIYPDLANPGNISNILAESWSISPNGSVYTFHLKQNIKYQDGTPFNAYTMKYSIDRDIIINDGSGIGKSSDPVIVGAQDFQNMNDMNITQAISYLKAGGVVAQDEFTLLIKVNQPYKQVVVPLLESLQAYSPAYIIKNLPSDYTTNQSDNVFGMVSLKNLFPNLNDWTKLGLESNHDPAISGIVPQADSNSPSLNNWALTHVVGTGPYTLSSSTIDNITLVKNDNWLGSFVPNSPDKVVLINDKDSNDRSIQFLQGNSDVWYPGITDPIFNYVDANGNSIIDGVTAFILPSAGVWKTYFNLNDKLPAFINASPDIGTTWNMSHIIDDNLVRYSTNSSILASIDNPFTALKFREAFSYAFDYSAYLQDLDFNIFGQKAHGLIPKGNFGYQENSIAEGTIPKDINATKAQQLFEEVGWRGNITLYLNTTHTNEVNGLLKNVINILNVGITINLVNTSIPNLFNGADLTLGNLGSPFDSYGFVNELRSNNFVTSLMNYSNPTIDNLLNKALSETDSAKLLSYYNEIEQIAAHDYYTIYLNDVSWLVLVHNWVHTTNNSFDYGSYDPQYIAKYQNLNTSSISSSSSPARTPGFEFFSLSLFLVLVLTRKKFGKK